MQSLNNAVTAKFKCLEEQKFGYRSKLTEHKYGSSLISQQDIKGKSKKKGNSLVLQGELKSKSSH
jgi:hypothetical protein